MKNFLKITREDLEELDPFLDEGTKLTQDSLAALEFSQLDLSTLKVKGKDANVKIRRVVDEARRRIDWEAAKTRVLSILMERARRNEPGLSNKEIRQITRFDRNQARRLMQELMQENTGLQQVGERRWARYEYSNARQH